MENMDAKYIRYGELINKKFNILFRIHCGNHGELTEAEQVELEELKKEFDNFEGKYYEQQLQTLKKILENTK
jgi:hypothetical protein